jgi:hypothetical protein
MPLNIGATGSIKPYVKFNAKADKWFAKGETGDVEIGRPTFIADLANIATGWLNFKEGQAPERAIDPSHDRAAPCPGEGFKRGFVLAVYSQNFFGVSPSSPAPRSTWATPSATSTRPLRRGVAAIQARCR